MKSMGKLNTLDLMQPVRNAIGNAANVDEVSDVFCFVVGFVTSELTERIKMHASLAAETERSEDGQKSDLEAIASYTLQLAAVEKAWETYKAGL